MENDLIICTINGKEVFCEDGQTILTAAKSIGIDIPVLCFHPEIGIIGSCRVCVRSGESYYTSLVPPRKII